MLSLRRPTGNTSTVIIAIVIWTRKSIVPYLHSIVDARVSMSIMWHTLSAYVNVNTCAHTHTIYVHTFHSCTWNQNIMHDPATGHGMPVLTNQLHVLIL